MREFCLKFVGVEGNVFSQQSIILCQKIDYNPGVIKPKCQEKYRYRSWIWSFQLCHCSHTTGRRKIQAIYAEEYARDEAGFLEMIDEIWKLKQRCHHLTNIYIDAANPEIWQALKKEFNEPFNEQYIRQNSKCKKV